MKRLKISFLAIVAIAAMSFTVASNVKPTNDGGARTLDDTDCFLPNSGSQIKKVCEGSIVNLEPTTCVLAKLNYGPPAAGTFHLYGLVTTGFIESNVDQQVCPDNSGEFCCFNIVVDNAPLDCPGTANDQPQFTIPAGGTARFYKVSEIRCKIPE